MPALRLALLLLLLTALPGRAQTPIHRCIGANGQPVFTDRSCADLQATPAPAESSAPPPSLRAPAVTCAGDVDQLRQAVIETFASGDANRLAGLMLWTGYGEHAAVADIRSLAQLMREPLVDIAASGDDLDSAAELVIRTMPGDGSGDPRETHLAIEPDAGCLWLRPE